MSAWRKRRNVGGPCSRPRSPMQPGFRDKTPYQGGTGSGFVEVLSRRRADASRGWGAQADDSSGSRCVAAPFQTADDASLVHAVQDGDRDAYSELYRRHLDDVRRLCIRRLGDGAEAEEAAQTAFVRA